MTKKDEVEALAKEHEHVDVLFNVAGYVPHFSDNINALNY